MAQFDKSALKKQSKPRGVFKDVPEIDLSSPNAETLIVEACKEFGFFKVINPDVSMNTVNKLENEALNFFNLTEAEKADGASCLRYGNKNIGRKGDMGWVEYLLMGPSVSNQASSSVTKETSELLQNAKDYISAVKLVGCNVLTLIAQGLNILPTDSIAELIENEGSDWIFRINHYPEVQESSEGNLVGFGEHTDPQIISILRSNNVSGLEICLKDESWVSVPSDPDSLFISVGDCLEVMTNGRLQSVRHRVSANSEGSRLSMIYFAAPPLEAKITPLPTLVREDETVLYKKFTWSKYKESAGESRLGDNRLAKFRK